MPKIQMTKTNVVPALRAPAGSCGPHRPFHIPTVTSAHSHPAFTLGLLQMYTRTHKYKHTSTESQRTWWVHAHTCTHMEVRSVQSPRVVPASAHGSLSVAPTCPHAKPRPRGRASPSRGPAVCPDVGQQAEGVHTRVHARDGSRSRPVLGPDPLLARAALHSPVPSAPSLPPVLSEPTGALAGSVPTPTRTRTQDKDRCGAGLSGRAPQTRAAAARGGACCGQPAQGGKGFFLGVGGGREGRQRVQSPTARGLVGAEAVGSWPVLPGAVTWPGYAHGRTYGAMRGAGTLHRTQTHTQLQAAVQEAGPGRSGLGVGTPQQGHTQATWEQ